MEGSLRDHGVSMAIPKLLWSSTGGSECTYVKLAGELSQSTNLFTFCKRDTDNRIMYNT